MVVNHQVDAGNLIPVFWKSSQDSLVLSHLSGPLCVTEVMPWSWVQRWTPVMSTLKGILLEDDPGLHNHSEPQASLGYTARLFTKMSE